MTGGRIFAWTYALIAAVTLTVLATDCFPQSPDVPPEAIVTGGLPLEGAPHAELGPYDVMTEPAFGLRGLTVLRPMTLDVFPNSDTLPVLVWGNGGCVGDSAPYAGFLSTIASHGFLILATSAENRAGPWAVTAEDLRAAIDWAVAEDERAGSPLNGKIATGQIAVMGQSCGGFLSITLGADPRVDTIGVFNSGVQPDIPGVPAPAPYVTLAALAHLHGPVLLINGDKSDSMMERSRATFDALHKVPVFYGARHNAGHAGTIFHPGGGEFANVASNWLMWWFKGNTAAGAMFLGRHCTLCTNPNWDAKAKMWRIRRYRLKTLH